MFSIFAPTKEVQNESHMKNLIMMARSDNSIDKSEVDVIMTIGEERGLRKKWIKELLTSSDKAKIIQPETQRDMFDQLYDLTRVMCADDVIEDDEMEFVTGFANRIGFRKVSSAFIVDRILEGMEDKLNKNDIFDATKIFMRTKIGE